MPGMNAWWVPSLAAALLFVGPAWAGDTVVVHRCVDAKGRVSLQDDPCPKGSQQSTREMQRPVDAPARAPAAPAPPASAPAPVVLERPRPLIEPPPMYLCTSYDGIVRESEVYDPNPRCEPLALYYPNGYLTPQQAGACRWVQDSCVRLSDAAACERFRRKRTEASSAAMHAFSDTAAYRKSEVERLTQIIDESCR